MRTHASQIDQSPFTGSNNLRICVATSISTGIVYVTHFKFKLLIVIYLQWVTYLYYLCNSQKWASLSITWIYSGSGSGCLQVACPAKVCRVAGWPGNITTSRTHQHIYDIRFCKKTFTCRLSPPVVDAIKCIMPNCQPASPPHPIFWSESINRTLQLEDQMIFVGASQGDVRLPGFALWLLF